MAPDMELAVQAEPPMLTSDMEELAIPTPLPELTEQQLLQFQLQQEPR